MLLNIARSCPFKKAQQPDIKDFASRHPAVSTTVTGAISSGDGRFAGRFRDCMPPA
jgi:hypothetical protein